MAGKFSWDEYFAHTNPGCNAGSSPNVADAIRRNAGPADAAEGAPPAEEAPQPRNGPSFGEDATRTPGKKPYMLHAGLAHSEVVPELPRAPRKPAFVIQVPASAAPEPVQETAAPTAETVQAPESLTQDIFAAEQEVEVVEPVLSSEEVEAALSTWAELAGVDPRAEAPEPEEDEDQEEPELEADAPEVEAASEEAPEEQPDEEPELEPVMEESSEPSCEQEDLVAPVADAQEQTVYELEPVEEAHAEVLWRCTSYRMIAADIAAFRDSTPLVGIVRSRATARRAGLTPCPSLPMTMEQERVRSASASRHPPSGTAA